MVTSLLESPTASALPKRLAPGDSAAVIPFTVALLVSVPLIVFSATMLLQRAWPPEDGALGVAAMAANAALALVIVVGGTRWGVTFVLAFRDHLQQRRRLAATATHWPKVSVLVPSYNEAEVIDRALKSLIDLDYPNFEILVVDDGSNDDGFARAQRYAGTHAHCTVRVFRKPNGGKWSAHNFALNHAEGDLVLCVDADSGLERDALRRLVSRLEDPRVGAVAGQIRVRNRKNTLTWLQALEYLTANSLRMAQSALGTVLIVPGPIGLFRRSVLAEVHASYRESRATDLSSAGAVDGPFEGDTFAEDFDLSLAILSLGYRVEYEREAISHTKAPASTFGLLNQRYRWVRGSYQAIRKYLGRVSAGSCEPNPTAQAWIGGLYLLDLLLVPMATVATLLLLLTHVPTGAELSQMLTYVGAYLALAFNVGCFHVALQRDQLRVLAVVPLMDMYQGLLLSCGWYVALWDELRGRPMRW
ncbi:MAG: glycosyltransferase family 2 protein [Planctomycetota bacterium]